MADPSTLAASIESLGSSRVACVGDVMLDRFVYGRVERTSPEAPVPILRTDHDVYMLGGAGNVVRNLVSLGARATLLSVIGDDEVGRRLTGMVGREERVEPHLLVERGRLSTEKTRFVAGAQQLLRTDSETTKAIAPRSAESLLGLARDAFAACDVVVLSDYAKGVLTPDLVGRLIETARSESRPVVVDPKGRDFGRYAGATALTPNRAELAFAAGEGLENNDAIVAACRALIVSHGLVAILVTRGRDGMTLVSADGRVAHLAAEAREVFDVSGAGDTVVATLAAALGQGMDLIAAAQLANTAAGVAVGKAGTAAVHAADLLRAVRAGDISASEAKIVPLAGALEAVAAWRGQGQRVGFTNGCFDLLHPGHISLLRQARQATDRLVVGLNSDASVRRLKGEDRPVQGEAARAQVLASLETVDLVVVFAEDTPMRLIVALRPDCLVKGSDYTVDEVVGADAVQGYGGTVLIAENEPGYSTSGTIRRLRAEPGGPSKSAMPANRDIRDRYTDAIGAMEAKHRTMGVGHQIPKNTSLAQCIGYARRFVIESPSGDPHYRYDRYMCGLKATLRQYPVSAGTVVHVDIGCGPGLFTWVVRDYFRNIPQVDVELYGYDHAPKMVKLARLIWEYMEECVYYSVHDSIDDLFSTSMPGGPRPSAVLVTLGHVLVQTANDESAMKDFASIIATFAQLADCRVVAVDAMSGRWPTDFQRACGQLRAALEKLGSIVDIRVVDRSEMRGVVRVASQP